MSTHAAAFRAIAMARRSTRRFQKDRIIKQEVLDDILASTIRSPSSFNLQPTQMILVKNQKIKQNIADEAMLGPGNQYRTSDCSVLAAFLADLEPSKRIDRIQRLEKDESKRHSSYLSVMPLTVSFLLGEGHAATALKHAATSIVSPVLPAPQIEATDAWSTKQTALVAQSFVLAATSHELASSMMEGFDPRRLKEILRIPDRYKVPLVVALGYDHETEDKASRTARLGISEVVFGDVFGQPLEAADDTDDNQLVAVTSM